VAAEMRALLAQWRNAAATAATALHRTAIGRCEPRWSGPYSPPISVPIANDPFRRTLRMATGALAAWLASSRAVSPTILVLDDDDVEIYRQLDIELVRGAGAARSPARSIWRSLRRALMASTRQAARWQSR